MDDERLKEVSNIGSDYFDEMLSGRTSIVSVIKIVTSINLLRITTECRENLNSCSVFRTSCTAYPARLRLK